ncbi:MAG: SpoIIE family protein phosphatase [Planctomycetales bacterium]
MLSADAANDSRFSASESISNFTIRSMMCVPMLGLDGNPMGVINLDTQNPMNQFQKDDLDLLLAVASQAAMSYESARLLVTYMEKQKQDSEMGIARKVQQALLPEQFPEVNGYQFYASYDAAQAVGGDYYGCTLLEKGNKICLAFGDVAGKGVPASLVMSRLSSVVESTLNFVSDAGQAVERINHHMCSNAVEGRFVTFVLTIIDFKKHRCTFVNAGHMSPIIRRANGTLEELPEDAVGLPIGVADEFPYEVVERDLQPGDTVVIYTDGVSEAMNPQNELFTIERLRDLVRENALPPSDLAKKILEEVRKHANGRAQNDDITLMAFGRSR